MPAILEFDRFCLSFPPLSKESDFDRFWNDVAVSGRKIAIDPELKANPARSSSRFDVSDVSFSSTGKVRIHAVLHIPKTKERPHPVIVFHDYNAPDPYKGFGLDEKFAYLFVRLRGHESITHHKTHAKAAAKPGGRSADSKEAELPGYFAEGISAASTYYVKGVYCDALRCIDLLRLNRKLDCSTIAVIGKGIGAAAAVYCAAHSDRVAALVLDSPAFVHLEEWLNESESDISAEIAQYIKAHYAGRAATKKILSYFDALNFAEDITCDTLMSVGLRDEKSPAKCSFALFNHLRCDKTVEVYPDDGNDAGGEKQWKKSLAWLRKKMA
jgi:cephalosporin-C deacetylase